MSPLIMQERKRGLTILGASAEMDHRAAETSARKPEYAFEVAPLLFALVTLGLSRWVPLRHRGVAVGGLPLLLGIRTIPAVVRTPTGSSDPC